ncbi:MAG: ribonuclease P protein component [Desulfonatronovibrio sp. MSAO_Bac4]|nr:MAG: ribonuclease P protein component [Desulfonatronovibrio sp. MSAO_Bac4]
MVRLTYGRHLRITKRPLFQECYSRGRRYLTASFIIFIRPNDLPNFRLGIAVPGKVGTAVKRNRIKRLVRECFRLNQYQVKIKSDIVVVCKRKPGLENLNQAMVNNEIMTLLDRVARLKPGLDQS